MENSVNPGIFCSVQQCQYNESGSKCTANRIEVGSGKLKTTLFNVKRRFSM